MTSIKVEQSPKRVRVYLGGQLVADTHRAALVWEVPYYPMYWFPAADVVVELRPTGEAAKVAHLGEAEVLDVTSGSVTKEGAVRRFGADADERLRDLVRFEWDAMDEWLEEDEPVYVHPRNPYARVDILGSSKHVRVVLDGETVAESRQPRILFETGLPARYYLPMSDVRMDLLRRSDRTSHCPYKGTAGYFSVQTETRLHQDVVWVYRTPLPESQKIAGLVCFWNERVELWLDGVKQDRPKTPFS